MAPPYSPNTGERPKIKKRKYSRKGCQECKRRKIKCDEQIPACHNCARLNKSCTYSNITSAAEDMAHAYRRSQGTHGRRGVDDNIAFSGEGVHAGSQLTVKFWEPKGVDPGLRIKNGDSTAGAGHSQGGPRGGPLRVEFASIYGDSGGVANSGVANSEVGSREVAHREVPSTEIGGIGNIQIADNAGDPGACSVSSVGTDSTETQPVNENVQPHDSMLSFLPLDMQNFSDNVNVFLDDFYLNHAVEPSESSVEFSPADVAPPMPIFSTSQTRNTAPEGSSELTGLSGVKIERSDNMEPHKRPNTPVSLAEGPEFNIADFPLSNDFDEGTMALGGINEHLVLSNSQLTEQCIRENMLREPHVYYLRLLTSTDLSFHLFPFAASVESNGVVKLLLTYSVKCTYLLTSLLAISATFQFIRTSEKRHDDASQFYIDVCFKALTHAFRKHCYFENSANFASSIEKLLLTVLIVSTRFTATTTLSDAQAPSSWKDHLKGARDLLNKYSQMTKSSSKSQSPYMSSGLALAKCWFFAIETSAAIHTSVGGALSRASAWDGVYDSHAVPDLYSHAPDIDLEKEYHIFVDTGCIERRIHPEYHQALSRVQLVSDIEGDSVFNLYWGFNSSFLRPVLAFVSFTDAVKLRSLPHVPFKWTMHLLGLLDISLQDRVVPGVCLHTFEIPRSSIGHPEYEGPDKLKLPESCYVSKRDERGHMVFYSWFDASHQFHGDYLSLRIMVSQNFLGLPRSHPDVQYLIKKFFDGAFFIKSKASAQYEHERHHVLTDSTNYYLSKHSFDIRCIMIQSLFRLISGVVVDEDNFEKIELYFMGVLKLGNGSSLKSLDMVARVRSLREENQEKLNGETDEKIYDFYDSMNDIPFS